MMQGIVRFFNEPKVKFTQNIRITDAAALLKATIEFQVCVSSEFDNSGKCIPGYFDVSFDLSGAGGTSVSVQETIPGIDSLHIDSVKIDTSAHTAIIPPPKSSAKPSCNIIVPSGL